MNEPKTAGAGTLQCNLHAELRVLIIINRQRTTCAVNAELTRLYRTVRQRLASEARERSVRPGGSLEGGDDE